MRRLALAVVALSLFTAPLAAQQHVVDPAALDRAMANRAAEDDANRARLLRALDTPEAQQVAGRLGVDLQDARSAISTLSSAELGQLADTLQSGDVDLAGGASTVVISTTTLLLIIIIVILLAS